MRIKLKRGKQKELILRAKADKSWTEIAKNLNISKEYLRISLTREKILLSEEFYKKLCLLADKSFDDCIINKLENNLGASKGGLNSKGSTISLIKPKKDEHLAEFIGALLGDGNINEYKKGKKIGVYQIKIAGDYEKDKDYHLNYLKKLCESLFNLKVKEVIPTRKNARYLAVYSKELIEFFKENGMFPGNKIKNHSTMPNWILKKDSYIKACLRGLIDTDGSIFRMSNKDPQLIRISFTNNNNRLLEDVRKAFISLGFNPSKIISNKQIFLSRKEDIERYLKEIGFSNQKHIQRLQNFRNNSAP